MDFLIGGEGGKIRHMVIIFKDNEVLFDTIMILMKNLLAS